MSKNIKEKSEKALKKIITKGDLAQIKNSKDIKKISQRDHSHPRTKKRMLT